MQPPSAAPARIPLPVKIAFTVYMAVLVPVFCVLYGPAVMLYFCCVALLLVWAGLWLESPLLIGMAAVGVLLGQMLWTVDFLSGARVVGMTGYMYEDRYPLYARGLTLFHVWLPVFMLWLFSRIGYDRRALLAMTLLGWAMLTVSYLFLPAPGAFPEGSLWSDNINYVYGLTGPQTWMHPHLWFGLMLVAFPVCFYLPAHLVLRTVFHPALRQGLAAASGINEDVGGERGGSVVAMEPE